MLMLSMNGLIGIVVSTVLSVAVGAYWYSFKGFGRLYIESYYGSMKNFETRKPVHTMETTFALTILCPLVYNYLLVFLLEHIYSPTNINEMLIMAGVLVGIHILLEAPHIGYENRSYSALMLHVAYHYLQTILPILLMKYYFYNPHKPKVEVNVKTT